MKKEMLEEIFSRKCCRDLDSSKEVSKEELELIMRVGTGSYSLYYAKQGYNIHALEYVKENLDVLKANIEEGLNISPVLGDARNLSMYEDKLWNNIKEYIPKDMLEMLGE